MQEVLELGNMKKKDVDEVLLVGGCTRIPKVSGKVPGRFWGAPGRPSPQNI